MSTKERLLNIFNLVYVITFTVCIITLSVGTSVTWTSPVLPKLLNHTDNFFDEPITKDQASWIAAWLTLGMAVGNVIYGYLSDKMGRKLCFLTVAPFMAISYVIMSFVNVIEFYYVARFLAGIGRTGGQVVSSLYIAEIANKRQRGSLLGILVSLVSFGFLYSYAVGPYVSIQTFNITLFIFPCLFFILFIIVGVETPYYYISKGNKDMARETLLKLRSKDDNIEEEITEIEDKIKENRKLKMTEILKLRATKIGFIIAFGLFTFQQLTGFFCIQFYNQQIFEMTGSNWDSKICVIIIGSLQFVSGFFTSIIMERFTRKTLLYASAVGMALSEIPLGIYCYLNDGKEVDLSSVNFIPILTMSLFVLTYNIGFGPLPFVLPFEIFPPAIKGFAVCVVGFVNSIVNFLLAKYFQAIIDAIGLGQLFGLFAIFCLLSIPFVKFFVVETRGKSLQAIQTELMENKSKGII